MAGMVLQKPFDGIAKTLAGVGALNWGTSVFANFDVLTFVPEGIATQAVVGAIALSGAYVLQLLWNKRI